VSFRSGAVEASCAHVFYGLDFYDILNSEWRL
jgi:hypothetical protein